MQIGVNTEQLSLIYSKLQAYKEDFGTLVTDIGTQIDSVPEVWDGEAAVEYQNQWESLKTTTLNDVENLLDTIGVQVGEVIDAMDTLDSSIADKLRKGMS